MRSIGKVKIKKLKAICAEELKKPDQYNNFPATGYSAISSARQRINERIPEEWFDIWESAHSEIERLINDEINNFQYKR